MTANRADYHRAMLSVLRVEASQELLDELEASAAGPVIEVYPDVRAVLEQLRAWGVRMSVVSDKLGGAGRDVRRARDLGGPRLPQAGPAHVRRRQTTGRTAAARVVGYRGLTPDRPGGGSPEVVLAVVQTS
ncbi:hypothetical protein [Dactylosporangium sp. NPDC005555]|uniref:hypothetical protein n=1 Tax=Dactylosporangium sp. NPDC005555 TaxID=3154889 RepID=UPI0033B42C01